MLMIMFVILSEQEARDAINWVSIYSSPMSFYLPRSVVDKIKSNMLSVVRPIFRFHKKFTKLTEENNLPRSNLRIDSKCIISSRRENFHPNSCLR